MDEQPLPTPQRIVKAASRLFHAEGIRAVSMDAVAARAGVTKRTLYYHFRSKDDLVTAYLEGRDLPNLAAFQRWFAAAEGDVAQKFQAIFHNLAEHARQPEWKGCGFLRTAVELIEQPGHPAMVRGRAHKKRVENWFCSVLVEAGAAGHAPLLARQVMLLMDGSFSVVLLHRDPSYMEAAGQAVVTLIRASMPPVACPGGAPPQGFSGLHPDSGASGAP